MLIKDWTVQAQWDDSKIKDGLRKLDKAFDKVGKKSGVGKAGGKTKAQEDRAERRSQEARGRYESRRIENQKKFIFNLDKELRILQRQERALGGIRGSESTLSGIRGQRAGLEQLRAKGFAGGFATAGMGDLHRDLRLLAEQSKISGKQVTMLSSKLTLQQKIAKGLGDSVSNMARSYVSAFAVIAGAVGVYRVGEELEQVKSSLLAVSGSALQAGKDFQYIKTQALRLGVDLPVMAKGFQQIGTAGKAMNFTMADVENIFLGAAESSKAFNLSTDDTSGVMRAFVQIMSKGY